MKFEIVNNAPNIKITTNESNGTIIITLLPDEKKSLGDYDIGTVVKLGKREYIVLGHTYGNTELISKEFVKKMAFGKSGDYLNSDIRTYLNNDFYKELAAVVGKDNIVKHQIDLTADDGTGLGSCEDYISILTTSQYRKYRSLLPAYGSWWYTATRVSASADGYARSVCGVGSGGVLGWGGCGVDCGGVRPFCILKSCVLTSQK